MELIDAAVRSSDRVALDWRVLYEAHAPELARFVTRLVRDDETASDLVQEVFIRGMRSESQLTDRDAVRAWLFRIATNIALSHLRRRKILAFVPFTGGEPDDREVIDVEADHVRRALARIAPAQAVTLVLCLQEGWTRREASALLGVDEETIKSRLARGRIRFAQEYARVAGGR
ncbi:MAG TPA: RNA polymerase sigma factor [Candidatus Limnocylindrales bacterium]|nr:RNA polymerase sigma factor [Candidatus Limnocylindrales bacterium]